MRRLKDMHSEVVDFTYSTKRKIASAKDVIIPDDYSFLLSERNRKITRIVDKVKVFHMNRRNTIILLSSVFLAWFLLKSGFLSSVIPSLAEYKYVSALLLGLLFPLGFTTAPVAATLYSLSAYFNPVFMAFIAAIGAMIGNLLIFFFVKYELVDEIRYIFTNDLKLDFYKFELNLTKKRLKSKWFRFLTPVFSGLLIALPVPTEMIVSILWNINKVDIKYVMLLSFTFSFIGFLFLGILHG
jgi:hypothetical protein